MKRLTSINNEIIKETKQLHNRKNRDNLGKYIIEGWRLVTDAIENGEKIETLFITENIKDKRSHDIINKYENLCNTYILTDKIMNYICDTETPQGIAAVLHKKNYSIDDILKYDRLLILDRIQDPGNAGTILRTADAFGISAVILLKGTVDIYSMKVVRSTMGSIFHVPSIVIDDSSEFCTSLKKAGFDILVTHLEGSSYLQDVKISQKAAFIVGNEGSGVSNEIMSYATKLVKIPMKGRAESLNVSVAASIVMYHMMLNQ